MIRKSFVAALLLLPAAARADWQYTKWGMTVDEVRQASRNQARDTNDEERRSKSTGEAAALLTAPYDTGTFKLQAYFQFSRQTNRLDCVYFQDSDKPMGFRLFSAVRRKYGMPIHYKTAPSGEPVLIDSLWHTGTDVIQVMIFDSGLVTLRYCNRSTPDTKGL